MIARKSTVEKTLSNCNKKFSDNLSKKFTIHLTDVNQRGILMSIYNHNNKQRRDIMNKDIVNKIEQLKAEKNAVILAHYYVPADVQAVADYVGDSFYLAKVAKATDADIIVFCGVSFMGESAKILNPDKKVLMPDLTADCAMAHMVAKGKIAEMREKYDDLAVVCYINSTAALKCESDVCVTSSNAVNIVKKLPQKNIFFIPDKNLGRFVAEQVPEKNVILNDGCCPIHDAITAEQVLNEKASHPTAKVLTHPECTEAVLAISDYIGSTADIIKFAKADDAQEFIIVTENGVNFRLQQDNPNKKFYYPNPHPCCADMKFNTLEKLADCLENETNVIEVSDELRANALKPLDKMLEMA